MARIRHGQFPSLEALDGALKAVRKLNLGLNLASAHIRTGPAFGSFDYMFPELQSEPSALLEPGAQTVSHLTALGEAMSESGDDPAFESAIPSAYTYFGQFIAHDITLELQSQQLASFEDLSLTPLPPSVVREKIVNARTAGFDLDSLYGVTADGAPVPRRCDSLVVGGVVESGLTRPPNKDDFNDLPRKPTDKDPHVDREALIGDVRNDENLIISQLHLAFLRAHNTLVARGLTYREARKLLTHHYRWLIVHDYLLTRVADAEIVRDILRHGNRFFRPPACGIYVPLEFSAAAFRFGHSMIRSRYDYNVNFRGPTAMTLEQLFTLGALRGPLAAYRALPEHWIIEWKHFMDRGGNDARRIDTRLVVPLSKLSGEDGQPIKGHGASLAVSDLLRGYLLRIPTGQAVARALGKTPLAAGEIRNVAAQASKQQEQALLAGGFDKSTPLWYYILAEAAAKPSDTLGVVGSTLVAEVLIGLVRWSEDSILSQPAWQPTLGQKPGLFTLEDLLRLGSVWA